MTLRVLLVAVLLAAAGDALSGETWLLGPGLSRHFQQRGQNEGHPGIGLERHFSERVRGIFDVRKNSSGDLSLYAVGCYMPARVLGWATGACGGMATGYDKGDRTEKEHAFRPVPFGGGAASLERKTFGLNIFYVPGIVVFLQVKFPLD